MRAGCALDPTGPRTCVCRCRCDNITISPQLLGELEASTAPLPRKLDPSVRDATTRLAINATTFSALHNADQVRGGTRLVGGGGLAWHAVRMQGRGWGLLWGTVSADSAASALKRGRLPATVMGIECAWMCGGACAQMAVDKLAQGIEGFAVDQRKLEDLLAKAAAEL